MDNSLGGQASVWGYWKNAFSNNHLPIVWKSIIAVLQEFQAVLVTPIMTDPLYRGAHMSETTNQGRIYIALTNIFVTN